MILYSIASSSSGNCYIYDFETTKIMVDLGINYKTLKKNLEEINIALEEIDAVFLTHEHSDHLKGLEVFQKKHTNPIYLTKGTDDSVKYEIEKKQIVKENEKITIADVEVLTLKTSHDAKESIGFIFNYNDKLYGHLTDTGYISLNLANKITNLDFYLIESNYDEQVLLTNDEYPYSVKKRINSDVGHLSNKQTNQYLKKIIGNRTKTVCFAHLSEKNNDPELVEIINETLGVENKYVLKKSEVVKVICK